MTSDQTIRSGTEARAPRLSQHQHLLHPSKTDEIEVLESGGIGEEQNETKVGAILCKCYSFNLYLYSLAYSCTELDTIF